MKAIKYLAITVSILLAAPYIMAAECVAGDERNLFQVVALETEDGLGLEYQMPNVERRLRFVYNIHMSPSADSDEVYEMFNSDNPLPYINAYGDTSGLLEHRGEMLNGFLQGFDLSEAVFWVEFESANATYCTKAKTLVN